METRNWRRWRRGLALVGCVTAAAATAGCKSYGSVRALNASREVLSLRLIAQDGSDDGIPITGAVMGPMGRFEFAGPLPASAELRIRRWEDGKEHGETLVLGVPPRATVQTTVDIVSGRLLLRETSVRSEKAW